MGDVAWSAGWLAESRVRLLDTVLVQDGEVDRWLYTSSKTGKVACKESSQLSWPKVARRFSKFALSHKANEDGLRISAVLLRRDGGRRLLDDVGLAGVAGMGAEDRKSALEDVSAIQVYLRPELGLEAEHWCRAKCGEEGFECVGVGVAAAGEAEAVAVDASIEAALVDASRGVLERIQTMHLVELRFVKDDHGALWLSRVLRVRNAAKDALAQLPAAFAQAARGEARPSAFRVGSRPSTSKFKSPGRKTPFWTSPGEEATGQVPGDSSAQSAHGLAPQRDRNARLRPLSDGGGSRISQHLAVGRANSAGSKTAHHGEGRLEAVGGGERTATLSQDGLEARSLALELSNADLSARLAAEESAHAATLLRTAQLAAQVEKKSAPTLRQGPAGHCIAKLLEQAEMRESGFFSAERDWVAERSKLAKEAGLVVARLKQDHLVRADADRAALAKSHDALAALSFKVSQAESSAAVAKQATLDVELELRHAELEVKRLGNPPLTASGAASLDRARAKLVPGESKTAEAALRQLHNKVVFLQSCLAAEMETRVRLQQQLGGETEARAEDRLEAEQRLAEARLLQQGAAEASERHCAEQLEKAKVQVGNLEASLSNATAAYSDSLRDAQSARRREEAATLVAARETAIRQALEKTGETLTAALAVARRPKPDAAPSDDAIARRLHNEKLYLQAQLTSEATCKGELEAALRLAHAHLGEARTAGEKAALVALNAAREASAGRDDVARKLRALEVETTAQREEMDKEVALLRSGYGKTRDLLRVEQGRLERCQIALSQLEEEVDRIKSAVEERDAALLRMRDRAREDAATFAQALGDSASAHCEALEALRKEASAASAALKKANQDHAARRSEDRLACAVQTKRAAALGALGGGGWLARRTARRFHAWRLEASRMKSAEDARVASDAGCQALRAKDAFLSRQLAETAAVLDSDGVEKLALQKKADRAHFLEALHSERSECDDRLFATVAANDAMLRDFERAAHAFQTALHGRFAASEERCDGLASTVHRLEVELGQFYSDAARFKKRVGLDKVAALETNFLTAQSSAGDAALRLERYDCSASIEAARGAVARGESATEVDACSAACAAACAAFSAAAAEAAQGAKRRLLAEQAEHERALSKAQAAAAAGLKNVLKEKALHVAALEAARAAKSALLLVQGAKDDAAAEASSHFLAERLRWRASDVAHEERDCATSAVLDAMRCDAARQRLKLQASLDRAEAEARKAVSALEKTEAAHLHLVGELEEGRAQSEAAHFQRGFDQRDSAAVLQTSELKHAADEALLLLQRDASSALDKVRLETKSLLERASLKAARANAAAVAKAVDEARLEEKSRRKDEVEALRACHAARRASALFACESRCDAALAEAASTKDAELKAAAAASGSKCRELKSVVVRLREALKERSAFAEAETAALQHTLVAAVDHEKKEVWPAAPEKSRN